MNKFITGDVLFDWHQQARRRALDFNISPVEIDFFLQYFTNLNNLDIKLKRYQTYTQISLKVSFDDLQKKWNLRLKNKIPLQYLIGSCFWRNLTLRVSNDVLIPRPETELIIDIVLDFLAQNPSLNGGNWLDLGTGSGAIAISLAENLVNSHIFAVDKSCNALKIARENSEILNITNNITFRLGSWFEAVKDLKENVNGIVSNPPYIPTKIIPTLQPEVKNYEPILALDGGEDGLRDIKYLIKTAPSFLVKDGILIMEIMAGQAPMVVDLFYQENQYHSIRVYSDLAGIERFVMAQALK